MREEPVAAAWAIQLPFWFTLVALISAVLIPVVCQAVSFSDGDFEPGDWEILTVQIGQGGWTSASQIPSGGNPGAFRSVTCHVNEPGSEPARIFGIHRKIGATYDPLINGPVAAISYSEDALVIDAFGQGQGTGPAIIQNGMIFVVRGIVTGVPTEWQTIALTDLTAGDFSLLTNSGFDDTVHPDFSGDAVPFDVGFLRGNGSPAGGNTYETTVGIDNWMVSIEGAVSTENSTWGGLKVIFK